MSWRVRPPLAVVLRNLLGGCHPVGGDLDLHPLQDRLYAVLGPGRHSYRFERMSGTARPAILCHLQIGRATRSGVGQGHGWRHASGLALADAAAAFGIGQAGARSDAVVADIEYSVHSSDDDLKRLERPMVPDRWAPDGN